MTSEQLQPILNWLKKRYRALVWTGIYLKNFLLRNRLQVKNASLGEILLIKGSPINIDWKVSGCHKIAIDKVGIFPGNLKGITYTCEEPPYEIIITFYGFNAKAKVIIEIPQAYAVELKNSFHAAYALPSIKRTSLGLNNPTCGSDKIHLSIKRLKMKVPNANLIIGNSSVINTIPKVELALPAFSQQEFSNN